MFTVQVILGDYKIGQIGTVKIQVANRFWSWSRNKRTAYIEKKLKRLSWRSYHQFK